MATLTQVLLDALPQGFVPDNLDLDEVNIEEALSAVSENLAATLGSLGGGEGGVDISQLGSFAGQFGGAGGIDFSQLGSLAGQLGSDSSDGSGFDFSQFGGLGSLGSLGSQLAGATGYNLRGMMNNDKRFNSW